MNLGIENDLLACECLACAVLVSGEPLWNVARLASKFNTKRDFVKGRNNFILWFFCLNLRVATIKAIFSNRDDWSSNKS